MRSSIALAAALLALPCLALAQRTLHAPRDPRDAPSAARIEGTPVTPGAVATSPITVVAPRGARRGAYTITPMPGVRLFSDSIGELVLQGEDSTLLPITYGVPRTRASGSATIAHIVVQWDDRSTWAADVEAEVRARHALRLALISEGGLAFRGRTTPLRLVVSNGGNAADTVMLRWSAGGDWQLEGAPLVLVLGAGETVVRTVELRCPKTSAIGEVHITQVTGNARGGTVTASAAVRVAYAPASSPGFVEAPSTLFLGSTLARSRSAVPSFAVSSSAQFGAETELSLVARRRGGASLDPVLSPELAGQTFRLGFRRDGLRAAVGDVWQPGSALTGLVAQGRGLDLGWGRRALLATLLVARPSMDRGHSIGHLDASVATRSGRVGLSVMHVRRAGIVPGDTATAQSAGLTYTLGMRGDGFFGASLGALRLEDARGHATIGLGLDVTGEHASDDDAFSARLHLVPATPAARDLLPTSAFLSASRAVTATVRALATGSTTSIKLETGTLRSMGLSAGASAALGSAHATLLGNLHTLWTGGPTARTTNGRGASASLTVPVWLVTLDGYAEHGLALFDDTAATSDILRGGVRWSGNSGWFWAGAMYGRSESGSLNRSTEVSGAYRTGQVELQAGTNALMASHLTLLPDAGRLDGTSELQVASFWSRVAVSLTSDLSVIGGTSYQQHALGSPWRVSIGVRQRLAMPLPVRQTPVAQGVVFEDRNGNREWDRGEPTVGGVAVALGVDRVVTGDDGSFAFLDPALRGQPLRLDGATVPIDYLVPPGLQLPNHGRVSIPLVRTASVTLSLFVDANADSVRNDAAALPGGIVVTVTDSAGRTLDAAPSADGEVVFPALLPGRYNVTIPLPRNGPRAATTRTFELVVPPGERIRKDVPLPSFRREIRFNDQTR